MCGLIGYTGNEGQTAKPSVLKKIMAANDSRGGHSSGYYDGEFFTKVVGKTPLLSDEINKLKTNVFIGHTRFATHGEITCENQHPFQYDNIIGAHNGVLNNYIEVGDEVGEDETTVDSQMIFKVLNAAQKSPDFLNTLGLFSGTLATIFTDTKAGLVYAYRNGNPLYVGRDNKGGAYFSSLKPILHTCGLKQIFELKEERVYVFKGGQIIDRIDINIEPVYSVNNYSSLNWYDYGSHYRPSKPVKQINNWYPATYKSTGNSWSRTCESRNKLNPEYLTEVEWVNARESGEVSFEDFEEFTEIANNQMSLFLSNDIN